jgi:hypothetical protein
MKLLPTTHPVTGDPMNRNEAVWWQLMSLIRGSWFLPVFSALTVYDWFLGRFDPEHLWWNLAASYLAIVVESIVGRAMTWLALRDSMRSVRNHQEVKEMHAELVAMHQEMHGKLDTILTALGCELLMDADSGQFRCLNDWQHHAMAHHL